jgi:DGQHR domain-containing protein
MHGFFKAFTTARKNGSGELTLRIDSKELAQKLIEYIFQVPQTSPHNHHDDFSKTKTKTKTKATEEIMAIIEVPAARVKQGALTLYTTSIKVRDLIVPGFYSVETLDPENANDKGYQRLLNTARAKRLADYIVDGQEHHDAFLPTSVFLATDKLLPYDEDKHFITIDVNAVGPFSVVDGQHRLEGLRLAAGRDERTLDFDVPVNIAIGLPKIHQMCHFLIVNTTQKSVDASVEQRIIARLTEAVDIEEFPTLPRWIRKRVDLGDEGQAVQLVDYLHSTQDSPWFGKVAMANVTSSATSVNQRSFVKAIVKYVLTANNPLNAERDFERQKRIFLNYWKAVASLLDDGNSSVLYKYNGVELFCKFSIPFFMKLQVNGSFTVQSQTELLKACFENVDGEYTGVGHPEWWASGSTASGLNAGALNKVAGAMGAALNRPAGGYAI